MLEDSASISLRALLELDAGSRHPLGLADVLGDRYLCERSTLWRRLRERVVDGLGYTFSTENALRYHVHPMFCLDGILTTRRIPYLANRWAVEWMDSLRPGYFTARHLMMVPPVANYLAHESSHAIASDVFRRLVPPPAGAPDEQSERVRLLGFLLPEAFANVIDALLLTTLPVGEEAETFARLNSYVTRPPPPALLRSRERLIAVAGERAMFEVSILCFLAANFTFAGATADHARKIARVVGTAFEADPDQWTHFMAFCRYCYGLNMKFTVLTNEVYLNAQGFTGTMEHLTSFCPFEAIEASAPLRAVVRELAEFAIDTPVGILRA